MAIKTAEDVLFDTCKVMFGGMPGFTVKVMDRARWEMTKVANPQFAYCIHVFTTAMENYAKTNNSQPQP